MTSEQRLALSNPTHCRQTSALPGRHLVSIVHQAPRDCCVTFYKKNRIGDWMIELTARDDDDDDNGGDDGKARLIQSNC